MNYRVATQENLPVLLQFGKQLALLEARFDETNINLPSAVSGSKRDQVPANFVLLQE